MIFTNIIFLGGGGWLDYIKRSDHDICCLLQMKKKILYHKETYNPIFEI